MLYKKICGVAFLFFLSHAVFAQELLFAINEGVTYQDEALPSERFKLLIKMLAKELKRPIRLQTVSHYADFERELANEDVDLAFIHPANVGLTAVNSGNYFGLATAKNFTDYRARIMVKADSPLNSLADLRGKKIGVPSMESITTVMFIASLGELGISNPAKQFSPTRYQDAVPFMLDYGFVDAGVTGSASVAKSWIAKGGRVIAETKPVPIKQFLMSRRFSAEEREKIQNLLLQLNENDDGKAALAGLHVTGFVAWNAAVMDEASKRLGL